MKNNKKPVTIKDIAKKLNMHHTTVSRALRDSSKISRETKELVFSLAEELDYHPNNIAQGFKTRQSKTIGVILPNIKNDFFAYVLSGIENIAHKAGYNIMITQSDESYRREVVNVRALISNQVCGALVGISQKTETGEHFEVFNRRNIPFAFLGRACKDFEANKIVADNVTGSFKATEYLIEAGYKRIAHLSGPACLLVCQERVQGYKNALLKHDLPYDESLVIHSSLNTETGATGLEKLWQHKDPPDAIFTVNDPVAFGV